MSLIVEKIQEMSQKIVKKCFINLLALATRDEPLKIYNLEKNEHSVFI